MDSYIARQPIFDKSYNVMAYELLYRSANKNCADVVDGNSATRQVLSDAITLYGLNSLADSKRAFVNFTSDLILDELPKLASPESIVVELLEDIDFTPEVLERVRELKKDGYILALDDYTGDPSFDEVINLVDIVKVDFMLTSLEEREDIASRLKGKVTLLAEKVETSEEFERAREMGFALFQGYFFSKPTVFKNKVEDISATSFAMLMNELCSEDCDINKCTEYVCQDAVLLYRLMRRVNTLAYSPSNEIISVKSAIVMMGLNNFKHWLILVFARSNNRSYSKELPREAFLRGVWAKNLAERALGQGKGENAFMVGMFSMLDKIFGTDMDDLIAKIKLPEAVNEALIGEEENVYFQIIDFIQKYEKQSAKFSDYSFLDKLDRTEIYRSYLDSLVLTDKVFKES